MQIINESNIEKAKNQIRKSEHPIAVQAQDYTFNRKLLEYGRFDTLILPSKTKNQRTLRKIEIGIDYIATKAATKNKVTLSLNLNQIKSLEKKQKAIELEKLIQTLKILRKSKTKFTILNQNSKQTALSFLLSAGASSQQAKQAINS